MFNDLKILREKPIPALDSVRARRRNYRNLEIDQSAPLHKEHLVCATTCGLAGRNHYAHDRNPPYWAAADGAIDALWVRESVGARLAQADARLREEGLKLFLYDAWRPRAVQAYFHDVWMPNQVRARRPDLDAAAVIAEVERYWAAPTDDPARPAPHATGGAVDLTIVWVDDGAPLYMGSLFDDATALAHTDRFEQASESFSDEEARANRRLIYWTMIGAGFANHPDEWWHYSYGDQMWAALTGAPAAPYGPAEPPPA